MRLHGVQAETEGRSFVSEAADVDGKTASHPLRSDPVAYGITGRFFFGIRLRLQVDYAFRPSAAAAAVWKAPRAQLLLRPKPLHVRPLTLLMLRWNRSADGHVLLSSAERSCEERLKVTEVWESLKQRSHPLEAILGIKDQKRVVLGMRWPLFSFEVWGFFGRQGSVSAWWERELPFSSLQATQRR